MSTNIRINRICEYCGQQFTAKTTQTRFCSHKCASRAYKARKRAEKLEASKQQSQQASQKPLAELKAKDYLSISEVCTLTGISRWTVWRQIKSGKLPAAKLGQRTLIRKTDLESLFYPAVTPMKPKQEPAEPDFSRAEWYYMGEIQEKFGISEKALYSLIKRMNLPVVQNGKFRLVPKAEIHKIFN